ncbi:MAG TPA: helix-turn-helix transcriptional regulator [Gemmataceae bacterium]|jgi:DNA-binding XRE family transcriptional regulator|nr:helix-turn-helix transcriptional regulator [Gemmataceae bacterium]
MPKTKKKVTPGQKLWLRLYRADTYDQEAEKIVVPSGSPRLTPERATRNWLAGMSRHLKKRFPTGLRKQREELGLTQRELAKIAELTVTAVAMIERGERGPNLDTAARLCWALDVAAGVNAEGME